MTKPRRVFAWLALLACGVVAVACGGDDSTLGGNPGPVGGAAGSAGSSGTGGSVAGTGGTAETGGTGGTAETGGTGGTTETGGTGGTAETGGTGGTTETGGTGGTTETGGTGGIGGTGGATGGTGGGTGGTGGAQECTFTVDQGGACDLCWHTACAKECSTAMQDPAVSDYVDCYYACGDAACADQCDMQYPTVANAFSAIYSCMQATCASECGECAPGCPAYWVGDNYCDTACNVAACNFDDGDCGTSSCTLTWDMGGPCDTCWHAVCSAECDSAMAEPTLNNLFYCYNGCSDQACVDACEAQYPAATATLNTIRTCIENNCATECEPDPCTLTLNKGGACDACWHASCATECGTALEEPTLNDLLNCYSGCSNQTCVDACEAQYSAAAAVIGVLMTCIEATCSSVCQ